jgi:cytochrome c556
VILRIALIACALGTASVAPAHSGASGVVKERMEAMKSMAGAMKRLGAMLRGNGAFDGDVAGRAATTLVDRARHVPMLFPDGSFRHPSEARPRIARERDAFDRHAADLGAAAQAMVKAAASGDKAALAAARRDAGRACSACHKRYREKKS